jgi:hypothetical protein
VPHATLLTALTLFKCPLVILGEYLIKAHLPLLILKGKSDGVLKGVYVKNLRLLTLYANLTVYIRQYPLYKIVFPLKGKATDKPTAGTRKLGGRKGKVLLLYILKGY